MKNNPKSGYNGREKQLSCDGLTYIHVHGATQI